ncbi:MAG: aminoglycoside phosphotransferase family protein [Acidimicrobiales bacterium]
MTASGDFREDVLRRCQKAVPAWANLTTADFDFDDPKGFSSFTIGVRARTPVEPAAVLYRQLEGKENAILDFETERAVFLLLGDADIAARCLHYEETCRIEAFYTGRTLTADDVFDTDVQRGIANELFRLHQLEPEGLPDRTFFELLTEKWGALARSVLGEERSWLPPHEQALCDDLEAVWSPDTVAKVLRCLPDGDPVFCHNDTYHGNVFMLDDGSIKLLDFEFSCLNHIAFDFANLFAETIMEHGLDEPPHFRIGEPKFTDDDLRAIIGFYLDNASFDDVQEREARADRLLAETRRALLLSDYMYAVAALPLALEPIQKIRFIPYSHQRFHRFLRRWDEEFG